MKLLQCMIICVFCVGCNCQWSEYTKNPTFSNMMCPVDQVKFQSVTRSALECVWKCDRMSGCTSLIYLHDTKTCFGIISNNPFSESSPLPGAVFYTVYEPETVAPGTPMVEGLPDSQFTASSTMHANYAPSQARFSSTWAWIPATQDTNQWLQVDFAQQILATDVATKGVLSCCWLTSYSVLTSTDCNNFGTIKDDLGNGKVFPGNTDTDTYVHDAWYRHVGCRCFRISPCPGFLRKRCIRHCCSARPGAACDMSLPPHHPFDVE